MTNKDIFAALVSAGMTEAGAAGMMGNIQHESGLISNRVEILCLKRLREAGKYYTDSTYTAFVDDGTISREEFLHPLPGKQYGYGLCQWTSPGRKGRLYDYARTLNKSIGDCEMQIKFLVAELRDQFPSVWKVLITSNSVNTCSDTVLMDFEMPANASSMKAERRQTSQAFYNEFRGAFNMSVPQKALAWMKALAADQSHGYSQANRWGPDYDCSSAVITAYQVAGVPVKTKGATYTGNMKSVFLRCGFADITGMVSLTSCAGMEPGDVLLNEVHHTAMYCGGKKMVHARGQSFGSPATGDQGAEIAITDYYNYPWNCVLRYTGGETVSKSTITVSLPTIKKGSRGDAVKVWQTIIQVSADGDFGPLTNNATIAYQRQHGLAQDGIVGPLTWTAGLSGL